MQNGLYVAASGMLMQEQRMDVISNNISNLNTNGFKRELAVFTNYNPEDKRNPQNIIRESLYNQTINATVQLDDIATDFSMGHLQYTSNKFDLAINDEKNFFSVETPFGIRYTRDGEFTVNSMGELVTSDGYNLIDKDTTAPIVIPQGSTGLDIRRDGQVYVPEIIGPIGTIDVARFSLPEHLQKVGQNLYSAVGILPEVPEDPALVQGFIESSNIDPIAEMVGMIDTMRGFEMYSKAVQIHDTINEQAANSIAKL